MSSFSLFGIGGNNPNAKDSAVVNAKTGETAPALPRWERNNNFCELGAGASPLADAVRGLCCAEAGALSQLAKRATPLTGQIVQETGTQYGRICPQCGERASPTPPS